jgi:hypothetical protein
MKILVYPFSYFDNSFYNKDVILFPKYYNKKLISDLYIINFKDKNNLYKLKNNYLLFFFKYMFYILNNRKKYNTFFFFHITLRNLPLIIITKILNLNSEIIIKADISERNLLYFEKLFYKTLFYKILIKFCTKIYIETNWIYNKLIDNNIFKNNTKKLIYKTNQIFNSEKELEILTNSKKVEGLIFLYIRANDENAANLKAFDRYIKLLNSNNAFFDKKSIIIVYDLNDFYENIFINSLKISDKKVVCYSKLDRLEFLLFLGKSEYFILLSNEESFNFTVLEAIIAKCKILTTEVGVIKDIKEKIKLKPFSKLKPIFSIEESDFQAFPLDNEIINEFIYNEFK